MNTPDVTGPLPDIDFSVNDTPEATKLLAQFGKSAVFDRYADTPTIVAYEQITEHPTHWILFCFAKGQRSPELNGLCFTAIPKKRMSRTEFMAGPPSIHEPNRN